MGRKSKSLKLTLVNQTSLSDKVLKPLIRHACKKCAECVGEVRAEVIQSNIHVKGLGYYWGFQVWIPRLYAQTGSSTPLGAARRIYSLFVHEAKHTADFQQGLKFDNGHWNPVAGRWTGRKKWKNRPEEVRAQFTQHSALAAMDRGDDPKASRLVATLALEIHKKLKR